MVEALVDLNNHNTDFEEVWQYGSQETDPFAKQDGIAPQKAISGIGQTPNGGRVPIDPSAPQNFLESHLIANYKWIFTRTEKQGYKKCSDEKYIINDQYFEDEFNIAMNPIPRNVSSGI